MIHKIFANFSFGKVDEQKIFEKVIKWARSTKDPQYQKELTDWFDRSRTKYPTIKQNKLMNHAYEKMKKGIVDDEVCKALNISLTDHYGTNSQTIFSKFYSSLKSKGYDAIMDVNDMKYSGYNSKKPVIVFNGASGAVRKSSRLLSTNEIMTNARKETNKLVNQATRKELLKSAAQTIGLTAAPTITVAAAQSVASSSRAKKYDKIVKEYRSEHPNTEMSYNDIINSYYSGK